MPLNTAVPSDRRISAPAPMAITSGKTPPMAGVYNGPAIATKWPENRFARSCVPVST